MKLFIPLVTMIAYALILAGCGEANNASETDSKATNETEVGIKLTTEIPPELIEGTPAPVKAPNLLPAPTITPILTVPEKTILLSRDKEVTSSDTFPIVGDISYITDGDKQAGEGYFLELIDGLQWVQIDLAQTANIQAIWIWHFHSQKRAYHDVIVQISKDPEFKSDVTTVFNNDYDNSSGIGKGTDRPYVESRYGKLIDVDGINGRYVRLYSAGNTTNQMNHYIEVEVFGIPEN